MSLNTDLSIPNPTVFHPSAISEKTNAFNGKLMDIMRGAPRWYEVGAEKYREMRAAGQTPLPAATLLDSATSYSIPSRDPSRSIPCRILKPQNITTPITSVFMHIHGGGWVLQDEKSQDPALQAIADATGLLCISVGYRLAPEYPFPAGPNDCYDAAEYLVENAKKEFGATLGFVGGESAGGHLSVLVALYLLQSPKQQYSSFSFKGMLLHFGAYDLSWTPSVYHFEKPETLVLDRDLMDHYIDVFLPGMSHEERKHPSVSPLYAKLMGLKLPPALFTCGTEDCLLDDTMFMATKWMMAGGDTIVKIIPGGCHGYIMFPRHADETADEGAEMGARWEDITDQLCATIAKEPVNYDSECLDRTFAEAGRDGRPVLKEPSLEQAAEDTEYAKRSPLGLASDCHQSVTDFTEEASEVMASTPRAEADLNFLSLTSRSNQGADCHQRIVSDPEASRYTPATLPTMIQSSSRTVTPGKLPDAATSMAREYFDGSPTPAVATTIEDYETASSPTTPTADAAVKSPKRRISFGMPVFGGINGVKMPPPKLRKASPTLEEQTFSHFVNADAIVNTGVEITFKDIPRASTTYIPSDNEVPKTPMLVEFGLPSSPVVIRDDSEESYPACTDGLFMEIPVHHLKSIRKTVDPTFQDDRYWGDSLYFSEEPVPSSYCETESSRLHSLDWRIIFHALDNDADNRIPLLDTTTMPQISDEQRDQIWLRFQGVDKERAISKAQMSRDWTKAQTAEAGMKWTEIRGKYYCDPPEFTTRSSQDICADPGFKLFCSLAQFVGGRPAMMPHSKKDTLSVLRYARMARFPHLLPSGGLLRQQLESGPQHSTPANTALRRNDAIASEDGNLSYPLRSPVPVALQDPSPALLQHAPTMNQIPTMAQNNTSLVNRAFHDINVFVNLPRINLFGMQQQYLQARAYTCKKGNRPVPTYPPTAGQLWSFFRQRIHANSVLKVQQAARETAASAETQASILRNSFAVQPGTPVSSRSVQLQSYMPTTPASRGGLQDNGTGNLAANPLGSPFRTPARLRSDGIDPRLLRN